MCLTLSNSNTSDYLYCLIVSRWWCLLKGNNGKLTLSLEDDHGIFYLAEDTIYNSGPVDIRVSNLSTPTQVYEVCSMNLPDSDLDDKYSSERLQIIPTKYL